MFTILNLCLIAAILGVLCALGRDLFQSALFQSATMRPANSTADLMAQFDAMEAEFSKTERHLRRFDRDEKREARTHSPHASRRTRKPKAPRSIERHEPPKDDHGVLYPKMSTSQLAKFIEYRKTLDSRLSLRERASYRGLEDDNSPCRPPKQPALLARCATLLSLAVHRLITFTRAIVDFFSRSKPPPLLPPARN